jgi:hypothetical protein
MSTIDEYYSQFQFSDPVEDSLLLALYCTRTTREQDNHLKDTARSWTAETMPPKAADKMSREKKPVVAIVYISIISTA